MRVSLQSLVLFFLLAANASAQDWAKAMFDRVIVDLGVVGRGANIEHRFKLKNIYVEDVHVASIRSTCGCTSPQATKPLLKTYETAEIVAVIDTRKFLGQKDVTITVALDQPFPAEVKLRLMCFIRSDVVFEPGSVRFGSVTQGETAQVKVAISYAGRNNWQIAGIQTSNPHLEAKVKETGRNLGQVSYDLLVSLKGTAPPGSLKEQLVLATNDLNPQTARILLVVDGTVVSSGAGVTAGPSPLLLGSLSPDRTLQRNLVVRGKTPFRILEIAVPDGRFRVERPEDSRTVHVLPLTIVTGRQLGAIAGKIRIRTDVPGSEVLDVDVSGQVTSPDSPPPDKPAQAAPPIPPERSGSQDAAK